MSSFTHFVRLKTGNEKDRNSKSRQYLFNEGRRPLDKQRQWLKLLTNEQKFHTKNTGVNLTYLSVMGGLKCRKTEV